MQHPIQHENNQSCAMKKGMFDFKEKAVKAETTAKLECLNEGQVLG